MPPPGETTLAALHARLSALPATACAARCMLAERVGLVVTAVAGIRTTCK